MEQKKTKDRPFYEPPENLPTSSKIISEARTSLRSLRTTRPYTPRDENRTLFGPTSTRAPENRPPSAFSLGSRHFDGSDSRPVSGTRLSPLDHIPKPPTSADVTADVEGQLLPPKPPSDPNRTASRKGSGYSRGRLQHSSSVDEILSNPTTVKDNNDGERSRRVLSRPKERTECIPVEERGVGDGTECPHRIPSAASTRSPPSGKDVESRHGSGGVKKSTSDTSGMEASEERQFYLENINPIIEELISLSKKKDLRRISELADKLYTILKQENLLGRNCKRRSHILKAVFRLLDAEEPKVLLQFAQIILSLKVTGNNLTNVCKLVFKVSRVDKNDQYFTEGDTCILDYLVECLQSLDVDTCGEALVYCTGSFKFLTGTPKLAKLLLKKDTAEAFVTLLKALNKSYRVSELKESTDQLGNILVQLTAGIRNLADISCSRERYLSAGMIKDLSTLMEHHPNEGDIMLNVIRTFSKLTLHTDCCMALSDQRGCYKSFLLLLNKHLLNEDLVVRVCFVVGNLTAKNDFARVQLFMESNSIETILSVLKTYLEKDYKNSMSESVRGENETEKREVNKYEDVLIKIVRVIANLSINDQVGPVIASNQHCLQLLLQIIDVKDVLESEELVLNTISTVNNLSYYVVKSSAITANQTEVAEALFNLVLTDSLEKMEALIESARVFGNLTRQKIARDYLFQKKVAEVMITLLDSGSREMVYVACGVLINFMADEDKRAVLKKEEGVTKLLEVLRDFGKTDWQLASIVCQVLWNYSGKIISSNATFGPQAVELEELLVEMLDEEAAMNVPVNDEMEEDVRNIVYDLWKSEFCPVATQLLNRIDSHQSKFESLKLPS